MSMTKFTKHVPDVGLILGLFTYESDRLSTDLGLLLMFMPDIVT